MPERATLPPAPRRVQARKADKASRRPSDVADNLDEERDDHGIWYLRGKLVGYIKATQKGRFSARLGQPINPGEPDGDLMMNMLYEPKLFDVAEDAIAELRKVSGDLFRIFPVPVKGAFWLSQIVAPNREAGHDDRLEEVASPEAQPAL